MSECVLRQGEEWFPQRMLQVRPQPEQLHVRGNPDVLRRKAVAIIGARDPSPYGMKVAYNAAHAFATQGLVVVSGMARGLDAQAHRGALAAGGVTVAVLGCGLDCVYPRQNRDLRDQIPVKGALITELASGVRPSEWTFPMRNRLIAAMVETLLVVEGRTNSGTMNTVEWMQKLGKDIWAVPGRLGDALSDGPNLLIQQGAHLYRSPNDLLMFVGEPPLAGDAPPAPRPAPRADLNGAEATLFDLITPQPTHVDDLATRSAIEPGLLLAALSTLELMGLIEQLPGKRFALAA